MGNRVIRVFLFISLIPTLISGCAGLLIVGGATGISAVHDRRAVGTVVDDQSIEFKGASKISGDKELNEKSNINVTSYNYIVLLTGKAPTAQMKSRAESIMRKIPKVKQVQNEITISTLSSDHSGASDAYITTKAKTSLFKIKKKGFDPTRVKVVTSNKTVYLMGLVKPDEADAAVERIRNIKGVQRVVKVFEYIKPKQETSPPIDQQ